ncbi:MAG: hypothetical protein ABSA40_03915 [Candidatus Dormibacteria bacterium]
MSTEQSGVDLSGLHRELDSLKAKLCRCNHQGTCLSCRGFEVVREQAQAVAAAASQPVLMQVAQEAAAKDLLGQLGGLQEMLTGDPQLSELMARFAERVQEDLGGPAELERMLRGFGLLGPEGPFGPGKAPGPTPYDDRPGAADDRPGPGDTPPPAHGGSPEEPGPPKADLPPS